MSGADEVRRWSTSEEVERYLSSDIGLHEVLGIPVEEDFACLDRSDDENADALTNPKAGYSVCRYENEFRSPWHDRKFPMVQAIRRIAAESY